MILPRQQSAMMTRLTYVAAVLATYCKISTENKHKPYSWTNNRSSEISAYMWINEVFKDRVNYWRSGSSFVSMHVNSYARKPDLNGICNKIIPCYSRSVPAGFMEVSISGLFILSCKIVPGDRKMHLILQLSRLHIV